MKRLDFSKPVTRRLTAGSNDYTNPNTNPTRPSRHVTYRPTQNVHHFSAIVKILASAVTKSGSWGASIELRMLKPSRNAGVFGFLPAAPQKQLTSWTGHT